MQPIRANQFFMLAGVSHSVMASCEGRTFTLTHVADVNALSVLHVTVLSMANGKWRVNYQMINNYETIAKAESDIIPADMVQGVIAAIVNDAFENVAVVA